MFTANRQKHGSNIHHSCQDEKNAKVFRTCPNHCLRQERLVLKSAIFARQSEKSAAEVVASVALFSNSSYSRCVFN